MKITCIVVIYADVVCKHVTLTQMHILNVFSFNHEYHGITVSCANFQQNRPFAHPSFDSKIIGFYWS